MAAIRDLIRVGVTFRNALSLSLPRWAARKDGLVPHLGKLGAVSPPLEMAFVVFDVLV